MKIEDFQLKPNAAQQLLEIDQLVAEGLSRERAQRIVTQLYAIVYGAWSDLLAPMANPTCDKEKALLQTFWVAYVYQWASDRIVMAGLSQMSVLSQLAALDGNAREGQ